MKDGDSNQRLPEFQKHHKTDPEKIKKIENYYAEYQMNCCGTIFLKFVITFCLKNVL